MDVLAPEKRERIRDAAFGYPYENRVIKMKPSSLIDLKRVSELTGFSMSALRKRIARGSLPVRIFKFGHYKQSRIRFSEDEVLGWIEKRRV